MVILNPETKQDKQTGDTYETGILLVDFEGLYHYRPHKHERLGIEKAEDYIRKKTLGKVDMTVGTVDDKKLEKIAKAMTIASNYAKRLFKNAMQSLQN